MLLSQVRALLPEHRAAGPRVIEGLSLFSRRSVCGRALSCVPQWCPRSFTKGVD